MKRFISMILFMLAVSSLLYGVIVEETGSLAGFVHGTEPAVEYDDWISHLTKRIRRENYNVYAPWYRHGTSFNFGTYHRASTTELDQWEEVCHYFVNEDFTTADAKIAEYGFPYKVVRFTDTDSDRTLYMLRENLNLSLNDNQGTPETTDDVHGGWNYSWGLYVIWPEAPLPIIVNFVHPGDDYMVPPLVVKAFREWDAKYMMMAGSSREADSNYSGNNFINDRSLSDPSRNSSHPFNKFYYLACDDIRNSFGVSEYSVQLHSYDWASNTHFGASNIQISAGPQQNYPSLPIRDHSSRKRDLIHITDYLVYPANTIGIHDPVYITDYYTVFYDRSLAPFIFDDGEHVVPVTNYITLPGAADNVQFVYTNDGHGKYEVTNRFLHVEFDELPYCYQQTETYWKWFYGYDISTRTFDMSRRFDRSFAYYSPFIDKLGVIIREMLALDDELPVDTPTGLALVSMETTKITVNWTPIDCYDFYTYEVLYSTTPNDNNPSTRNRTNAPTLASARTGIYTIDGLIPNNTYYISLRARDHNANVSARSAEITVNLSGLAEVDWYYVTNPGPPPSYNDPVISLDSKVTLKWQGRNQASTMLGFKIYRKTVGGSTVLVASYQNTTALLRTATQQNYTYTDTTPTNFVDYEYILASSDGTNDYQYFVRMNASPRPMYVLTFANAAGTTTATTTVGFSPFASDGRDNSPWYDLMSMGTSQHFIRSYQRTWWVDNQTQGVRLSQEVKAEFDMQHYYKSFVIRLYSNQGDVRVYLSDPSIGGSEAIVMEDEETGDNANLRTGEYAFTIPTNVYTDLLVHIGNVRPLPIASNSENTTNHIFSANEEISIDYTTRFSSLLDYYEFKLVDVSTELVIESYTADVTGRLSYFIPADVTMHNASVIFVAHCTDGVEIEYPIATGIGILPGTTTLTYGAYNNLITNPFPLYPLSLTEMGIQGSMHRFQSSNQNWSTIDIMSFGSGYLLKPTEAFTHGYSYPTHKASSTSTLSRGWNLVANPFQTDLYIKDLNFCLHDIADVYSYGELLQNNVLQPYVRTIREGILIDTDHIMPLESFLLYVNIPQGTFFTMQITPYEFSNADITMTYFPWRSSIHVAYENEETVSDDVIVSVFDGQPLPNDDLTHHTPKSVKLPNGINFYLKETLSDTNKYHSRTISKMSEEDILYTDIPFTLELPTLQTIVIDTIDMIDQLNYSARIVIDDVEYPLPLHYTPTELVFGGQIRIANEVLTPVADVVVAPMKISVYPNPFNPTTNIAFNLPKDTFVECSVYNIKGQKVKTLAREQMRGGNHTLTWNGVDTTGRTVGSGIYFVSINPQGQNRVVKKVTLMK